MAAVLTADSIAEAAQNLSLAELDLLVQKLSHIRASRQSSVLSQNEVDLLKRIEAIVPLDALQRRNSLRAIQQQRMLSHEEHEEFARLTDEIELAEAGRIELLSELASLRGVSLQEVARQLGLGHT